MSDTSDAISIRDAALPAIEANGRPAETLLAQDVPILGMRAGGCVLSLWGPFKTSDTSPWPEPATADLPGPVWHRLVVWQFGRVLVIDWTGEGALALHGFVRGPWEDDLLFDLKRIMGGAHA